MKNITFSRILVPIIFSLFFYVTESKAQDSYGGLALYTLRAEMAKDTEGTLKKVSETGYAYIEAAGYSKGKFYGYKPEEFKNLLEELQLKPISTHMGMITLENADSIIVDVKTAGFKYLTIPVPPMGMFYFDNASNKLAMKGELKDLSKILTELGKKCREAGLELLYHNHDFEFLPNEDGIVPIDYLLQNTDPEYVNFQMDLYWVTKAQADPLAYFEKYPNRFKSWHVKDMDEEGRFAPVGTGKIDFASILAEKEKSGMQYYFIEQDRTFENTPLEAIKISHNNLPEIGFKE